MTKINQEVIDMIQKHPDAMLISLYNITNEIRYAVYSKQLNAIYLTDDYNWVLNFLVDDLEVDSFKDDEVETSCGMIPYVVHFHLSGDTMGTERDLVLDYEFDEEMTDEEIEHLLWTDYCEFQLNHYEQYSGFHEYCEEFGLEENDDNFDSYAIHVCECGYYHKECLINKKETTTWKKK